MRKTTLMKKIEAKFGNAIAWMCDGADHGYESGICLSAEEGDLFDYWNGCHVNAEFNAFVEAAGWYVEWENPAKVILFPA
jgi:hypothetical protein